MPPATRTDVSLTEASVLTLVCFGWAIVPSTASVMAGFRAHAFDDSHFYYVVGVEIMLGAVALVLLQRRGYPVASLFPAPTARGIAIGAGLYVAALLIGGACASVVQSSIAWNPLDALTRGAHPSALATVAVAMVNGPYEEIFLLGVLMRGLRRFGGWTAVGLPLLVRLLYHTYQGPVGAVWVLSFGAILGAFYLRTGQLFPAIFAHVLGDFVPFV